MFGHFVSGPESCLNRFWNITAIHCFLHGCLPKVATICGCWWAHICESTYLHPACEVHFLLFWCPTSPKSLPWWFLIALIYLIKIIILHIDPKVCQRPWVFLWELTSESQIPSSLVMLNLLSDGCPCIFSALIPWHQLGPPSFLALTRSLVFTRWRLPALEAVFPQTW